MTNEEQDMAVGRAFRERKDLLQKMECLRSRLRMTSQALAKLLDNELDAESAKTLFNANDPRADFGELQDCLKRRAELDKILR